MSDSIGHEMLNHLGRKITVTAKTLRRLDMQHWLRRDTITGLLQFKPELTRLYYAMGPDHELGPDMSGSNVCACRCRECLDKMSPEAFDDAIIRDIRTREILQSIAMKRNANLYDRPGELM